MLPIDVQSSTNTVDTDNLASTLASPRQDKVYVLLIGGGSASGKSTVASFVEGTLRDKSFAVVSQDSFYKEVTDPEKRREIERHDYNFDHPDAIDFDLMISVLRKLKKHEAVDIPVYDFTTSSRLPNETQHIEPADVVLVEGIFALYNPEVRALANLSVFVQADADTRLIRRIRRDMKERARSLEGILTQYTRFVKDAHDIYIEPTIRYADVILRNCRSDGLELPGLQMLIHHLITELQSRSNPGSGRVSPTPSPPCETADQANQVSSYNNDSSHSFYIYFIKREWIGGCKPGDYALSMPASSRMLDIDSSRANLLGKISPKTLIEWLRAAELSSREQRTFDSGESVYDIMPDSRAVFSSLTADQGSVISSAQMTEATWVKSAKEKEDIPPLFRPPQFVTNEGDQNCSEGAFAVIDLRPGDEYKKWHIWGSWSCPPELVSRAQAPVPNDLLLFLRNNGNMAVFVLSDKAPGNPIDTVCLLLDRSLGPNVQGAIPVLMHYTMETFAGAYPDIIRGVDNPYEGRAPVKPEKKRPGTSLMQRGTPVRPETGSLSRAGQRTAAPRTTGRQQSRLDPVSSSRQGTTPTQKPFRQNSTQNYFS